MSLFVSSMYGRVLYRERWGEVETSLQNPAPVKQTPSIIKHLGVRKILFVLQLMVHIFSFVYSLKLFLFFFFGPSIFKYFKSSSNTLLRLPVCTVWPSVLIFFFHFYSFPSDHSIKSPSDFWRSLLGNFLAMWYQKRPERPLRHWREAGWGQAGLFSFHLCSMFQQWQGTGQTMQS